MKDVPPRVNSRYPKSRDVPILNSIYQELEIVSSTWRPSRLRVWPVALSLLFWTIFITMASMGTYETQPVSNLATHVYKSSLEAESPDTSRYALLQPALARFGLDTLLSYDSNDLLSDNGAKCSWICGSRIILWLGVPARVTHVDIIGSENSISFSASAFVQEEDGISYRRVTYGQTRTPPSQPSNAFFPQGFVSLNGSRQGIAFRFMGAPQVICLHQIFVYGAPLNQEQFQII